MTKELRRLKALTTTRNILDEMAHRVGALLLELENATTREAAILIGRKIARYERSVEDTANWLLKILLKEAATNIALTRANREK